MRKPFVTLICIFFAWGAQSFAESAENEVLALSKAPKPVLTGKPIDRTVRKLIRSHETGKPFKQSFRTLVALGPAAIPALMNEAQNEKLPDHQRWTAIRAVGRMGEKQAAPDLVALLDNPHPIIRIAALRALGDLGAQDSVESIREITEEDSAMLVRSTGVQALGQLKAVEAVPTLERTFRDERNFIKGQSLFIRRHVVVALGQMESRIGAPLLIEALDDRDKTIPPAAVLSLRKITGLQFEEASLGVAKTQWKQWWEKEQRRMPVLPRAPTTPIKLQPKVY